jgi:hypothetical protein
MVMGFVVDFWVLIICCGGGAFLQGVFEKSEFCVWCFCGEFVVSLWWMRGELW